MKVLIAYASVSGTTKKCACSLASHLEGAEVTICDLEESRPDPREFDFVAIGSPIRYGKLHPAVVKYVDENILDLKKVRCGIFICCGYIDSADEYIHKLFPEDLLAHSDIAVCFGGDLDPKIQKRFIDRLVLRMVRYFVLDEGKHDGEAKTALLPEIFYDSIRRFADKVRKR